MSHVFCDIRIRVGSPICYQHHHTQYSWSVSIFLGEHFFVSLLYSVVQTGWLTQRANAVYQFKNGIFVTIIDIIEFFVKGAFFGECLKRNMDPVLGYVKLPEKKC